MTKVAIAIVLTLAGLLACSSASMSDIERAANKGESEKTAPPPNWPDSLDAVAAAPGNHKVVLENEHVRVLEVTVRPGEREPVHGHRWPSVLYVMAEDNIRDYDIHGKLIYETKTDPNPSKAPYTVWMDPQAPHAVENLSKEPLRLLRVELKQSN
jgi:quercetin dioxygenase-like cupin family protein